MKQLFLSTLANKLDAKTIKRCTRWVLKCRYISDLKTGENTPYSFKYHPWTKEIHDTTVEHWAAQKAAQVGLSETALNISFHAVDQLNMAVLYGLPNQKPDAADFSTTRFNPAIDASPYLKNLFSKTKNMGLKMAGNRALYIRGSRGSATFKSIPVGMVILDEVDEMSQEAVAKAKERLSGQFKTYFRELSTPSIDNYGINIVFNRSTQDQFHFKCPHCSKYTLLIFPDCLKITADDSSDPNIKNSHLVCKECEHKLDHENKYEWLETGVWQPTFQNRNIRGFQISQLYSSTVHPSKIATSYLDSLTNPADEQEFYNSKLGFPRIVAGAKIEDTDIQKCIGKHTNGTVERGLITVGIDVGTYLHVTVMKWRFPHRIKDVNLDAQGQLLLYKKIKDVEVGFPRVDEILKCYQPEHTVIDAMPERRSSLSFIRRWPNMSTMCYYSEHVQGKAFGNHDAERVTVHRTIWLDIFLGRFTNKRIILPSNTCEEYKSHIKCLVRKYEKNKQGDTIARYIKGGGEDHYAHSGLYAEIALKIASMNGQVRPLKVKT